MTKADKLKVRTAPSYRLLPPSHRITMPQELLPNDKLKFGATFTDHMLVCDWTESKGWHAPAIVPYGPLAIDPAASVLHYSLQCFEGMKAYRSDNDDILLFRPDMNMKRLNRSMRRLYLPVSWASPPPPPRFPPLNQPSLVSGAFCRNSAVRKW